MQEYEDLKTMVAEIEDDLNKAEGGNKAAGTRVRKQMQQVKKVANAIRSKILELRSSVIDTTSSEQAFLIDSSDFIELLLYGHAVVKKSSL